VLPTAQAIDKLAAPSSSTNAILHVTC
jgi:hypothetical protein